MKARNISVTFHVDVYKSRQSFQVPRAIARVLDVKSGDRIAVSINAPEGELLYHGLATLGSGTEIYQAHIGKILTKGEEIRVTASLPPEGAVRSKTTQLPDPPRPLLFIEPQQYVWGPY